MNRQEFDKELSRVQSILPPPRGDEGVRRARFADELFNAMATTSIDTFRDVVSSVIQNHGMKRYLEIKEFMSAHVKVCAKQQRERHQYQTQGHFDRTSELNKQIALAQNLSKKSAIACLNNAEDLGKPFAPEVEEILIALATAE